MCTRFTQIFETKSREPKLKKLQIFNEVLPIYENYGKWQTISTKAYCPILFIVLTIHIALPNVNFIKVLKLKTQV